VRQAGHHYARDEADACGDGGVWQSAQSPSATNVMHTKPSRSLRELRRLRLSKCLNSREASATVTKARSEGRRVAALATSPLASATPMSTMLPLCAVANTWPWAK
jgi:hypothetical protein